MEYQSLLRMINNLSCINHVTEDMEDDIDDAIEAAYINGLITHKQFDHLNMLLEEIFAVS